MGGVRAQGRGKRKWGRLRMGGREEITVVYEESEPIRDVVDIEV